MKPSGFLAVYAIFLLAALCFYPSVSQANDCWQKTKTHVDAVACESDELKAATAALSALQDVLVADAVKEEAEMAKMGSVQYRGLAQQLKDSAAAFEAYKKAQCGYEAATYGAGTGAADAQLLCATALTKQRIKRLKLFKGG